MKNVTTILSTLAAFAAAAIPAFAGAQGVNERGHNQRERIVQGRQSGSLTKKESARLGVQQARVRLFEARNREDGGGYTARERARTQRRQNEASKDIYRKKHNGKDRG